MPELRQCHPSVVLLFTFNMFHTFFSVSVADFEQVNDCEEPSRASIKCFFSIFFGNGLGVFMLGSWC